jgi:hypothetical protein
MDMSVAVSAAKRLNIKATPLQTPIFPKGYNGVAGRAITHVISFDLEIDGYKLPNIPFLILDLGNQDAILGAGWMEHFDVLPDLKNRKLY